MAGAPNEDHPEQPPAGPTDPPRVPVVGLGGSAGGLEALMDLAARIPGDSGFAYVFVQHADPQQASQAVRIIQRRSNIPVEPAHEGKAPQPDTLYVAPVDRQLRLVNGVFHLEERLSADGHRHDIDTFLTSLARDRGPLAVGVVLSGTLTDGTVGLAEIRAAGGLTIAQSPATARFDGMPSHAIASGAVDLELSTDEMAKRLAGLGRHLVDLDDGAGLERFAADGEEQALGKIIDLVHHRTGIDFSQYKRNTIVRRLHRRLLATRTDTVAAYLERLDTDPAEVALLGREFLIHVTRFFRDDGPFRELRAGLLAGLLQDRTRRRPLRIWVPACSSGEEVYTLAMVVREVLDEMATATPVQIFGTDVSPVAIQAARRGVYPRAIEADLSRERLRRHFERRDDGHQISRTLRSMCVFAVHDVSSDPPFSDMDLVSCRNLLIYLGPTLQKRVLGALHYALNDGGLLLLGASESPGASTELFAPHPTAKGFFLRREVRGGAPYPVLGPATRRALLADPLPDLGRREIGDVARRAERIMLDRLVPPSVVVNHELEILSYHGDLGPFLKHKPGPASLHLLRVAQDTIVPELRALVQTAQGSGRARRRGVRYLNDGRARRATLEAHRMEGSDPPEWLITFAAEDAAPHQRRRGGLGLLKGIAGRRRESQGTMEELRTELENTRAYLQSVIEDYEATLEELRAANEEAMSSNEELQSTNEELATAKEELQSTNEELTTLNDELHERSKETDLVNTDLANLLASVDLPIVMLNADQRIRRFTTRAASVFNLINGDIGRPFAHIHHALGIPDLETRIDGVLATQQEERGDVTHESGQRYLLKIRPLRAAQDPVAGVVIVLVPLPWLDAAGATPTEA